MANLRCQTLSLYQKGVAFLQHIYGSVIIQIFEKTQQKSWNLSRNKIKIKLVTFKKQWKVSTKNAKKRSIKTSLEHDTNKDTAAFLDARSPCLPHKWTASLRIWMLLQKHFKPQCAQHNEVLIKYSRWGGTNFGTFVGGRYLSMAGIMLQMPDLARPVCFSRRLFENSFVKNLVVLWCSGKIEQ